MEEEKIKDIVGNLKSFQPKKGTQNQKKKNRRQGRGTYKIKEMAKDVDFY